MEGSEVVDREKMVRMRPQIVARTIRRRKMVGPKCQLFSAQAFGYFSGRFQMIKLAAIAIIDEGTRTKETRVSRDMPKMIGTTATRYMVNITTQGKPLFVSLVKTLGSHPSFAEPQIGHFIPLIVPRRELAIAVSAPPTTKKCINRLA